MNNRVGNKWQRIIGFWHLLNQINNHAFLVTSFWALPVCACWCCNYFSLHELTSSFKTWKCICLWKKLLNEIMSTCFCFPCNVLSPWKSTNLQKHWNFLWKSSQSLTHSKRRWMRAWKRKNPLMEHEHLRTSEDSSYTFSSELT